MTTGQAPVDQPERRGRRYTNEETCRRGLAEVANKVRTGVMDPRNGAVVVQALQAILGIFASRKAAELEQEAAELERRATEAAGDAEDGVAHA